MSAQAGARNGRARLIPIDNDDGTTTLYRRMSDRLPEFWGEYDPKTGYRLVRKTENMVLAHQPGLQSLYEKAIEFGRSPQDFGLPALQHGDNPLVTFTATLLDKEGQQVSSASATRHVVLQKDSETGETEALQRLMASLGYGGEMFDDDEDKVIQDVKAPQKFSATAKPAPEEFLPASAADPEPEPEPAKEEPTPVQVTAEVKSSTVEQKPSNEVDPMLQGLINSMKSLCAVAGVDVPEDLSKKSVLATIKAAKAKINGTTQQAEESK